MIQEIAFRTDNLCPKCFATHLGEQIAEIEVISKGSRIAMPMSRTKPSRQAKRKRRNQDPAFNRRKAISKECRIKAMQRLRTLFPDLYDIFLAEERARAGLNPWTVDMAVRGKSDPDGSETLAFARVYSALAQEGVDLDGLEVEPEDEDAPGQR